MANYPDLDLIQRLLNSNEGSMASVGSTLIQYFHMCKIAPNTAAAAMISVLAAAIADMENEGAPDARQRIAAMLFEQVDKMQRVKIDAESEVSGRA